MWFSWELVQLILKCTLYYALSTHFSCLSVVCLTCVWQNTCTILINSVVYTGCTATHFLLKLYACKHIAKHMFMHVITVMVHWSPLSAMQGYLCLWLCVSHQVLCKVIDEFSIVQALVIVEVVLKHGCDLLWSHHRSTHAHRILTRLDTRKNTIQICKKQGSSKSSHKEKWVLKYCVFMSMSANFLLWPHVGLGQPGVTAGWRERCGSGLWTLALLSQTWTGSPSGGWKHSGFHHSPGWGQKMLSVLYVSMCGRYRHTASPSHEVKTPTGHWLQISCIIWYTVFHQIAFWE